MSGFKMSLVADVSGFLKGTHDVEAALGKVSDSLDEVAKDAQTTATGVGTATDKMERSFRESFDAVKTKAKDAGDTIDRETHAGTGKAGEAVGEFKNEAAQNFAEVSSSFSGDMSQAADGVQGVLGGLAGSLPGPVGLISGLLAGIGGAMLQSFLASSAASKQAVSDMYDDMLASGLTYLSAEYQQTEISKIVKDESGAITKLADAQDLAKRSGQELSTVLAALTGDAAEQQRVTDGLAAAQQNAQHAYDDATASGQKSTDVLNGLYYATDDAGRAVGHWNDLLSASSGNLETAQEKVGASRDAMDKLTGAFDRTTDSVSRVSQGIAGLPDGKTVTIDANTTAAEASLARLKTQVDAFGNTTLMARVGSPKARASGGPVLAGESYIVGEDSPELFVPGQSGTVLNQSQILAAMGRGPGAAPVFSPKIQIDVHPSPGMDERALAAVVGQQVSDALRAQARRVSDGTR